MEKSLVKGNNKDTETKSMKVIIVSFCWLWAGIFQLPVPIETIMKHHRQGYLVYKVTIIPGVTKQLDKILLIYLSSYYYYVI